MSRRAVCVLTGASNWTRSGTDAGGSQRRKYRYGVTSPAVNSYSGEEKRMTKVDLW